jgi:hypothetical protein
MARPAPRRPAQGQQDRSEAQARQGEQAAPPGAEAPVAPPLHWGWRLALFLWATSFVFLLAYELLAAVFKAFSKRP